MHVDTIAGMSKRGGSDEERRARGDRTRRDLIDAGRSLFVDPGYFNVSVGDLVDRSGVGTRGAFYHHFGDKSALFRAVFEEVEHDLTLRSIAQPPPGAGWWESLERGLHDFLEAALEPEVQRIILIDGPVVLGWRTLRSIEERNSIAIIEDIVRNAMAEGTIDEQPVSELTHMLVAAVEEASLLVAHSPDPERARHAAARVLDRILLNLAQTAPTARRRGR
jgi:AcrR family transcriptional regulator